MVVTRLIGGQTGIGGQAGHGGLGASGPGDPINLGGLVDLPPALARAALPSVTLPGGHRPADLLAREPQAQLVRA